MLRTIAKYNKGFTLIEVTLYVFIVGIVVFSLVSVLSMSQTHRERSLINAELQYSVHMTMNEILEVTSQAESLDRVLSIFDSHPGKLVFSMQGGINLLEFYVLGDRVWVDRSGVGIGNSGYLTSDAVSVEEFIISDVSTTETDAIHVRLVLDFDSPSFGLIYDDQVEVESTFNLRQERN